MCTIFVCKAYFILMNSLPNVQAIRHLFFFFITYSPMSLSFESIIKMWQILHLDKKGACIAAFMQVNAPCSADSVILPSD
jgi:hypothetical protein